MKNNQTYLKTSFISAFEMWKTLQEEQEQSENDCSCLNTQIKGECDNEKNNNNNI